MQTNKMKVETNTLISKTIGPIKNAILYGNADVFPNLCFETYNIGCIIKFLNVTYLIKI